MRHDAHAMADPLHLVQLMRGKEHRDVPLGAQLLDHPEQPFDAGGIETESWIVQNHHAGLLEQHVGKPEALPHAPGVLSHRLVRGLRQIDRAEEVRDPRLGDGPAEVVEVRGVEEVLTPREIAVEAEVLGQVPHLPFHRDGIAGGVVATDTQSALGGLRQAQHHQDRRALAGPVRTEEAVHLALVHVQVDAVHRDKVAVLLDEPFGLEYRRAAHRRPSRTNSPTSPPRTSTTSTMPSQPQMVDCVTVTRSERASLVSVWFARSVME